MTRTIPHAAITSALLAHLRTLNDPGTPPLTARVSGLKADRSGRIYLHRFSPTMDISNEPSATETARIDAFLATVRVAA